MENKVSELTEVRFCVARQKAAHAGVLFSVHRRSPLLLRQGFLYFDPRQLRGSGTTQIPAGRRPFEQSIVFMVRGQGCWNAGECDSGVHPHPRERMQPLRVLPHPLILFQVGGGNYIEYQNLVDHCKRHEERHVVYGASQLVRAESFLDQLTRLGLLMGK